MAHKLLVKNISKYYEGKPVLKDINCTLGQGEIWTKWRR